MKFNKLFSEDGKHFSLGRVAFWLTFPVMAFYWTWGWLVLEKDSPASLTASFSAILLYNLGKKFTSQTETKAKVVKKGDGYRKQDF